MVKVADPRIVCAAMKLKDGFIVVGARHFDMLMHATLKRIGATHLDVEEQGFIDQFGNFLTRAEAMVIARKNGQIYREVGNGEDNIDLYSENLY